MWAALGTVQEINWAYMSVLVQRVLHTSLCIHHSGRVFAGISHQVVHAEIWEEVRDLIKHLQIKAKSQQRANVLKGDKDLLLAIKPISTCIL